MKDTEIPQSFYHRSKAASKALSAYEAELVKSILQKKEVEKARMQRANDDMNTLRYLFAIFR